MPQISLTQRNDIGNDLVENHSYDELNRLTSITLPKNGNATENSFTYDSLGNMLSKLDVGTYTYPAAGAPQPHGVASITGTPGTTSFAYDSDGNVTAETGATTRVLGWTMFNMPASISYGTKAISFQYDADHNRVMQTAANGTTYYLPDGELAPGATTGPVWHTYFQADGERVVEDFGPTGSLKHHFFHNDYQNTIGLVTDDTFTEAGWSSGTGIVQNELSDVFGQPRLHTGAIDPNWGAADVTKRRYINQEDLTPVQLINLNARVYDPLLGKFMSPDQVISDRDDSQSWNAYAYAHNNPMSRDDPTGLADDSGECDGGCEFWTSVATGGSNAQMSNAAQGNFGLYLHTPAGDTQITVQNALDLTGQGVYSTPDAASTQLAYIESVAEMLKVITGDDVPRIGPGTRAAENVEIQTKNDAGLQLCDCRSPKYSVKKTATAGDWPDDTLNQAMQDLANYLHLDLVVTGGFETSHHNPNSAHYTAHADDLGLRSNPGLVRSRADIEAGFLMFFDQTSSFMQFENGKGVSPHYHFQDIPLPGGAVGIRPGVSHDGPQL
jgi:RHS repeat-associated protein